MEGRPANTGRDSRLPTRRQLIIAEWQRLGATSVGGRELREIQKAIRKQFGAGAVESPAAIARLLADEGAELRHPEVIEFDAHWREAEIQSESLKFKGLEHSVSDKPLRLKQAGALIKKLEKLRQRFERSGDRAALRRVRDVAVDARQAAQSLAKNRVLARAVRVEQAEIAEWFAVWIQTPKLFEDWLELRRRSPEFIKRFSPDGT
jgi:hypothetical protein